LRRRPASEIAPPTERVIVDKELDPRFLAQPGGDATEDLGQLRWFFRAAVDNGEVEVLGESVGLVIALPKARPAFEDPTLREFRLVSYCGDQPAKYIVLLDYSQVELPLATELQ
jgi:hypothetical protein